MKRIIYQLAFTFLFTAPFYGQISNEQTVPYSLSRTNENLIFLSGQTATNTIAEDHMDFEDEVRETLENISRVLEEAESSLDDIISVTVYLTDLQKFNEFNEVYLEYFKFPYPTRTCIGVNDLVLNANIEITVTALKN